MTSRKLAPSLICLALLPCFASCGPGARSRLTPALARTVPAQLRYETVVDRWWVYFRAEPGSPLRATTAAEMVQDLDVFITRFPADPLSDRAKILKVLVRMDQQPTDLNEVPAEPSAGSSHDLWQLAVGRGARLAGNEVLARKMITELIGKVVDPIARAVFYEELVETSLGGTNDVVTLLDGWLRSVSGREHDPVIARVRTYVASLSKEALEPALDALVAGRVTFVDELRDALLGRLSELALATGDSELAKKVLDGNLASSALTAVQQELSELAASRRGTVRIDGRAVGLLLPSQSPELREEAADVLRGMMWALGLPRGVRDERAGVSSVGIEPPCAEREHAPFEPPGAFERLQLITRDVPLAVLHAEANGDDALRRSLERELDALLAQGAAVIVGGIDERSAALMLQWQRTHRIPMILLSKPALVHFVTDNITFVVGEDRGVVIDQIGKALGKRKVAPVIDESEATFYPAQGVALGSLTLLSPASCERPVLVAGDSRFPLAAWSKDRVDTWLVTGSHECARRLANDLSKDKVKGTIALTLEATMDLESKGEDVVVASAGIMPFGVIETSDADVRAYARRFNNDVTWWGAIGRDAGTLVRIALRSVPSDETDDPTVMRDRRDRIASALRVVRAPLWTSERAGFDSGQVLRRKVCVKSLKRR